MTLTTDGFDEGDDDTRKWLLQDEAAARRAAEEAEAAWKSRERDARNAILRAR